MAIRMGTRRGLTATATDKAEKKVKDLLGIYATLQLSMEKLVAEQEKVEKQVEELMKENGLSEVSDGLFDALYQAKKGNASTKVIPEKFKKLVPEKAFMEAVSITLKSAQQFLTERELEKCTVTTPGVMGEPTLTIKAAGKKKKK